MTKENSYQSAPSDITSVSAFSLATLYFTNIGQTPQVAIDGKKSTIEARILQAQNTLLQINGELATRQKIRDSFLNTDDGEAGIDKPTMEYQRMEREYQ